MTQAGLARAVGISRQRLGDLENGRGTAAPAAVWFALAEVLGRYLRFEFGRDPQAELADAGHLDIQELVLKVALAGGWERVFEARSREWGSDRSIDVRLLQRKLRRIVIAECWNTFGDLGGATRSSERKLHDAEEQAVALAGDGPVYEVGLVWIVRDTKANRALVDRYGHIFASRFPGSSDGWIRALTEQAPMPKQPGLVWCDLGATRLFARRKVRNR
jgi:DNA-binding XRE family transcriptional regulator